MLKTRIQLTKLLTLPGIHLQCWISFFYRIRWWIIIFIKLLFALLCFSPFIDPYFLLRSSMNWHFVLFQLFVAPYWTFRLQRSSSGEITTLFIVFNPLMLSDVLKADFMSNWTSFWRSIMNIFHALGLH